MIKIINEKTDILNETINGIMDAQPGEFLRLNSNYCYSLYKKSIKDNRVQIIISGGGSYGPLFPGFVGEGLADAVCHGEFDTAPNAYTLYEVAKLIHRGKGILFITNNYTGDYLNNDMAKELLAADGIKSEACYVTDNIFSAKGEQKERRGGLCGIGTLLKIASCAADAGLSLDEVYRITEKANDRIRTAAVRINEQNNRMEFGPGFSGEAPAVVHDFKSAADMVKLTAGYLMDELKEYSSDKLYFTVNRMFRMTYVEGYIVLHSLKEVLTDMGYKVTGCSVGSYYNVFQANGCIISILSYDDELGKYLKPVSGYDFTI